MYVDNNCYDAEMDNDRELKTKRLQMVIEPSQVAQIDMWRSRIPGVPSRSEAVRRLVHLGLRAEGIVRPDPDSNAACVDQ